MDKKITKKRVARKPDSARAGAAKVLAFMNDGDVPDFLSSIVQAKVDEACDYVGFARPMYDEYKNDKDNLYLVANLCRRTKMLAPDDLEKKESALAAHILAIIHHPETPVELFNKVADWITSATNTPNANGDSLLDQWTYHRDTVTALIKWNNEADDRKEIAEELAGKLKDRVKR